MKKENIKNVVIVILSLLLIGMIIMTVLVFKEDYSNTKKVQQEEILKDNENLVEDDSSNEVSSSDNNAENNNESQFVSNDVIEKYLGKWYVGSRENETYTNINIKKSTTGYVMDILVNKDADYTNLELHCAENSGVCYAIGDDSHHFSVVMAHDLVIVVPDYVMPGTEWIFGSEQ